MNDLKIQSRENFTLTPFFIKTRLLKKASFLFVASVFIATLLIACDNNSEQPTIYLTGPTMGTTYNITLVSAPADIVDATLQQDIDVLLLSLNQQMSTYVDDSEILQFNRAEVNQWFDVSPEFLQVITLSQKISALSSGRFDITIGPLVELWGFGKRKSEQGENLVPTEGKIADAKNRVGWQYLQVDVARQQVLKTQDVWLDVSAVAKGFAVDQITNLLSAKGFTHFLVEIGGEMRVRGLNRQQQAWRIGIETPSLFQKQAQQLVLLSDKAIATSGDYRNYFEDQGQRYSHTINPETGYPVRHNIASVTVIADTAAEADALATALNAMGEKSSMALAQAEKLAVYFIFYDNDSEGAYRIEHTPEFQAYLPEYLPH